MWWLWRTLYTEPSTFLSICVCPSKDIYITYISIYILHFKQILITINYDQLIIYIYIYKTHTSLYTSPEHLLTLNSRSQKTQKWPDIHVAYTYLAVASKLTNRIYTTKWHIEPISSLAAMWEEACHSSL